MILLWIFGISAYLILNAIITIAWVAQENYRHKLLIVIVLMLFGFPIITIMVIIGIIMGIVEVIKNEQ